MWAASAFVLLGLLAAAPWTPPAAAQNAPTLKTPRDEAVRPAEVPVCMEQLQTDGLSVRVATPACLQPAVETNVQHIILTNHMNLTGQPSLQDSIGTDAVLGSNSNTRSIRGNCLEPSPLAHPRYPWKSGQCVLTVREDFLQLETALPNFWVDQLYVRVVGNATGGHGAATLFGSHSGNLYMTRSTMVGDGKSGRAVDVREGSALYMRDCLLAHLSKDKQTTVRVKKAARATFVRTTFQDNLAITGDEKKVPVGPAVGLENDKKNASIPASAAWFHDCVFVNHTSTHKEGEQFNVAMHEVSIEDAKAEVYTNAPDEPLLFDREKNEIAHPVLVGPGETSGGVFGPVRFLTEDDEWFATVAGVDVGTGTFRRVSLPDPTQLAVWPQPGEEDDDDAAVAGLAAATAILGALALAAALLAFLLWRRRRKGASRADHDELASGKHASSSGGVADGFGTAAVRPPVAAPPLPVHSIGSSEPGFHQFPETDASFDGAAKGGSSAAGAFWPAGGQTTGDGTALNREFTMSSADGSSLPAGRKSSSGGERTLESWPGTLGVGSEPTVMRSAASVDDDHVGAPPRPAGRSTPGAPTPATTDGPPTGPRAVGSTVNALHAPSTCESAHVPFKGDTVAVAPTESLVSERDESPDGLYKLPPPPSAEEVPGLEERTASAQARSYTPSHDDNSLAPRTASSGGGTEFRGSEGARSMPGVDFVSREPLPDVRRTQVLDKTQTVETDSANVSHQKVQDMLNDVREAGATFEGKYTLLGATEQRLAGAGVVQFATGPGSGPDGTAGFALKFFTRRGAYDRIAALAATPALARSMWTVEGVYPNDWGRAHAGAVLPACVAMRRGETLDAWARRLRPNLPTALNALVQIAELMRDLHAAGYTYRNLKPSNVAWMPEEGRWALIDFACTVATGTRAPLSFSLNYAAPEVLHADEAGDMHSPASTAADIWSLGVLAFELLLLRRTFSPGTPEKDIRERISGRLPMPWEEVDPVGLRTLRPSVLQCLSRAPAARPSAEATVTAWRNLLDFAAVKHTEMGV